MSRNTRKRSLLSCLPWELLLLIGELLDLEELRAITMTCSYIYTALDSMLYKHAIATGVYKQKLLRAAVWGRATAISKFLREGVSMTHFDGHTGIYLPCVYPELMETTKILKIVDQKIHPLLAAAIFGHINVAETLLAEGNVSIDFEDEYGDTALVYAMNYYRLDMADFLLRQGAKLMTLDENDHNIKSPLVYAAAVGNKEALEMMYRELQNRSIPTNTIMSLSQRACFSACEAGFTDIVEFFLLKGFCVNGYFQDKGSLLYQASIKAHFKIIKLLVKFGARMENDTDTGVVSVFRHLPLAKAKTVVKELLKLGCNVSNGNRHACALWRIARGYDKRLYPDRKLLDLLEERGFDKEKCRDKCWMTRGRYRFQGDDMMSEAFFDYVKGDDA